MGQCFISRFSKEEQKQQEQKQQEQKHQEQKQQEQKQQEQKQQELHQIVNFSSSLYQISTSSGSKKGLLEGFERSFAESDTQYLHVKDLVLFSSTPLCFNKRIHFSSEISLQIQQNIVTFSNFSKYWIVANKICAAEIGNFSKSIVIASGGSGMIPPMTSLELNIWQEHDLFSEIKKNQQLIVQLQCKILEETRIPGYDAHWHHLLQTGIGSDVSVSIIRESNSTVLKTLSLHSLILFRSPFFQGKGTEITITIGESSYEDTIIRLISFLYTEELDACVSSPKTALEWADLLRVSHEWTIHTVISWCVKRLENIIEQRNMDIRILQKILHIATACETKRLEFVVKKKIYEMEIQYETEKLRNYYNYHKKC